jgi:quercetin dioxygenase-like cupin family protein
MNTPSKPSASAAPAQACASPTGSLGSEGPIYRAGQAQQHRTVAPWGSLVWTASKAHGNAQHLTLGRVVIKPGQGNPRHCHPRCEEVLYLLQGTIRHSLGDRVFEMTAGDTIAIPAGLFHHAQNIGADDADMIVAFSSGERDFLLEDDARRAEACR